MRETSVIAGDEISRLKFYEQRGGNEAATEFAKQAMKCYRSALAQRNSGGYRCGYGLAYRKELVVSCIVFRGFLKGRRFK